MSVYQRVARAASLTQAAMRYVFTGKFELRGLDQSGLANPKAWLIEALGAGPTTSGVSVTPTTALECPPVYAAIRVITEDLASLPLLLYRRLQRGKERAQDLALYELLHDAPNPEMDSMQFVETMQALALLRPCAYAEIVRDGAGEPTALWPIHPDRVEQLRVKGEVMYRVTLPDGQRDPVTGMPWSILGLDRMFRLRGLSLDGWTGLSPVATQREAIGLSLALQQHGARLFSNGAVPGGVMETDQKLSDQAYDRLMKSIEARHQGLANAHRTMLLEEGLKWHQTGLQNDQAQFLDSRRFSVEDVARVFRVKPHKIGDLSRATFSNIEHESIDHVISTIRPWAVRWERAIRLQLLSPAQRSDLYAEFLLDALLRGDTVSRFQAYATARQWGWMSADDILGRENENPLPDGKGQVYLEPENMRPAGTWTPAPVPAAGAPGAKASRSGSEPGVARRALHPVFQAAFARLVRVQSLAVGRAAKAGSLAAFEPKVTEFYATFEGTVREALDPAVRCAAELLASGGAAEVDAYLQDAARRVTRQALGELRAAIASTPADPVRAATKLAEGWEEGRAGELAAAEVDQVLSSPRLGMPQAAA